MSETSSSRRRDPILFVIGSLDVGGAERHLLQVVPELKRRGWPVSVFCLARRGSLASVMEEQGIRIFTPPTQAVPNAGVARRMRRLLSATLGLVRHLRAERPTIVHSFLPEAYLVGGVCALFARVPRRVMSRRSLNHYQQARPFAARLERWLHGRTHLVLGNSQAVVAQLRSEGVPAQRVRLIYNGLDLRLHCPARSRAEVRRELRADAAALVFVQVANLIPYKGHEDALGAFRSIRDRLPAGWQVWMVGRDDGIGTRLRALARELGLEGNVQWLGARRDVPDLLAAADIGVLCSHEEGFSNAVLESMAAGLPVVATDVGGNAEAVLHGKTGLIVPKEAPVALGEALWSLASAPEQRVAYGQAGRERVRLEFSLEACVDGYEACYRALRNSVRED